MKIVPSHWAVERMGRPAAIAILLVTVALTYGSSVCFDFVWDDETIILSRGGFFGDPSNVLTILTSQDSTHVAGRGSPYYRPLSVASYMLDYHLWGHDPVGYHLENLLLHAVVVLFIFFLVDAVLVDRVLAFIAAILFAVYPVHSESVSFVSARNNLLCTALFLSSLFVLWRSRGGGRCWAYGSLLLFFLSLLSKESAVFIPFFLASLALFSKERKLETSRSILFGFFVVLGAYFSLRFLVLGTFTSEVGPVLSVAKLRLMAAVYFENIRLILLPFRLNAHYTEGFLAFSWVKAGVACSGVALLVIFSAWRRSPAPIRVASQWVFWALLPVSNLVAIPSAPVAERYLYATVPGSALALAYLLRRLGRRQPALSLLITGALVAALGAATFTRNRVWANNLALDQSMIRADPSNAIARVNLGITYSALGRLQEAERELRESTRLDSSNPSAHYNLAVLFFSQNRIAEALEANEEAVRLDPSYARARSSLGVIYARLGRTEEAVRELETAIELAPSYAEGHNNLGMVYGELGRLEEALVQFRTAARLRPDLAATHFNLAMAHLKLGQNAQARQELRKAAELDSRYAEWLVNEGEPRSDDGGVESKLGQGLPER